MNLTEGLNAEQAQAVMSESQRILMLAGAGTGKTRTLTHRLAHLNLNCRVSTSSIIAITFTRAAAKEMKERLIPLIGTEAKKLICCTFHALAVRILQEWGHRLGLDKQFTIYSQEDREEVIKSIISSAVYHTTHGRMKDMKWNFKKNTQEQAVWNEYQWQLKRFNAVDLDFLILKVNELFTKHPDVAQYYRKVWKYVFVDEFQDTNNEQLQSIKLLDPTNLFGIGDDFQTIYTFNGARVENILEFPLEFPGTEIIKLETNYRSTRQIIEAANNLIRYNVNQTRKNLFSDRDGDPVKFSTYQDADAEANAIVKAIADKPAGKHYSDFAVLARTNAQIDHVYRSLKSAGIPCVIISGSDDPLKQQDVKSLLSYLDWIFNPKDETNFKRIIHFPERTFTDIQLQQAEQIAIDESIPLWKAMIRSFENKVFQFASNLNQLAEGVRDTYFASDAFVRLVQQLKLKEFYAERSLANRIADIERVITYILYWTERQQKAGEDHSPTAFLKWVKIRDIQEKLMEDRDAVKLMTIHGSKGLEFPEVFLIGMNEGTFPNRNTKNMEEERRLGFVAVTRAKFKLNVSSTRTANNWGKVESTEPSRFINEMKESVIL
ncbi:ATP-dependent helicase [Paenibacillus radicis (ex Xue et al. 2023)]|uniref:DNA 3'-5' helicase n=1 Tax=Paenibacillus radicis (ex Xue et al. 2023) TaxID=2972489 RepID=A0ABT1YJS7_9BACL|nr:ATP-dependent helicase [Paenibacillus radicis (ex Xue et al. 2023)]MCR8633453.1 ATP-dependent helicase [Paenibacillus radicis (ex Xue et al. 2023)]